MVAVTYKSQDFRHKLSSFENEFKRYRKCTFCNEEKETIEHLCFDCIVVSDLWKNFELCLKTKCGLLQINLSKSDILFGNLKFDTKSNSCMCKKIYISFKNGKIHPNINWFK